MPPDDRERKILEFRARHMAHVPVQAREGAEKNLILRFGLGALTFAVGQSCVSEVISLPRVTPMVCVPNFVAGIFNLRGRILSLIDLDILLCLPGSGRDKADKVIILRSADLTVGVPVEEIFGVASIPAKDISTAMPSFTGMKAEYVFGTTVDGLIILNTDKLLDGKCLVVDEKAGARR